MQVSVHSEIPDSTGFIINDADCQSIEKIVHDYSGLVYGSSLRILKNHQTAEDVSQAVFVLLTKKFKTLPKSVKIGGWLYRASVNLSMDVMKREQRRVEREKNAMVTVDENEEVWMEVGPVIDEFINQLPGNQRDAVRMKYLEGKSQHEIAEHMNSSRGTVSAWISRGIESLRKKLQRKGVVVSTAILASVLNSKAAAESPAGIDSLILNSINNPSATIQKLVDSAFETKHLLKLKVFCSVIIAGLAVVLGIYFSGPDVKSVELKDNESNALVVGDGKREPANATSAVTENPESENKISPAILGKPELNLPGTIEALDFRPDGKEIAVAVRRAHEDFTICFVDPSTQKVTREINLKGTVYKILYNGNEQLVCRFEEDLHDTESPWNINNYKVIILDIRTGKRTVEMWVPGQTRNAMAVSDKGKLLYVAGNYDLVKFKSGKIGPSEKKMDDEIEKKLKRFDDQTAQLKKAFAANDPGLDRFKDKMSRKLEIEVNSFKDIEPYLIKERNEIVDKVSSSSNQDLEYSLLSKDNDILIFDLKTGLLKDAIENVTNSNTKKSRVSQIILNGSKLVTYDNSNKHLREYDLKTKKLLRTFNIKSEKERIYGSEIKNISEDEILISGQIINLNTQKAVKKLPAGGIFNKDKNRYYCDVDKKLKVYSIEDYSLEYEVDLPSKYWSLKFNPDFSELILWNSNHSNYLRFDIHSRSLLESRGHSGKAERMYFTSDGRLIIYENDKVHIYDSKNGSKLNDLQGLNSWLAGYPMSLTKNESSYIRGGTRDGSVSVVRLEDGEVIKSFGKGKNSVNRIYFKEKVGLIGLKREYTKAFEVFDYSSEKKLFSLTWGPKVFVYITGCYFNNAGTKMYFGDGSPRDARHSGAFNPKTGQKIHPFYFKDGSVISSINSMAYNEKSELIYFVSSRERKDGVGSESVSGIINAKTGKSIKEFSNPVNYRVSAISDDGKFLFTKEGAYNIEKEEMVWIWKSKIRDSGETKEWNTAQFSEDFSSLLRVYNGKIEIRNSISGKLEHTWNIDYPNIDKEKKSLRWNKANKQIALSLSGPVVLLFDFDK